jgi:hypothetical protein
MAGDQCLIKFEAIRHEAEKALACYLFPNGRRQA